jgi:glutamate-1-semialdehyde 2,1-aminomutase
MTTSESQRLAQSTGVTKALYERALKVMPGGNTRTTVFQDPYPKYAIRGEGYRIFDAEGVERLDFLNNYTSLIHGHADPDVVEAVTAQLHDGSCFGFPTPREIELAEIIADRIPSVEQIRFTNSGSEAVMSAVQAARAHTGRSKIAKFEGSYHGNYDFASVSTALAEKHRLPNGAAHVPYSLGTPQGVLDNVLVLPYNNTAAATEAIERNHSDLAAVLVDPMPWRMGLIPGEAAFLSQLRELTTRYGIVLIFDEVITLRAGYRGLQGVIDITPDLTTMGKIIGGGFPVGAVGGAEDIMQVFDPRGGSPKVPHSGTFSANPVTMQAGITTLNKMTVEQFDRLESLATDLKNRVTRVLADANVDGKVIGVGSIFGIHLHNDELVDYWSWLGDKTVQRKRSALYNALLEHGIVVTTALTGCVSTPMDEQQIHEFEARFARALDQAIQ